MICCRPNVNVTLNASSGEVLILKLTQRNDLADSLVVCKLENVKLILVGEAVNDEVTTTQTSNEQITSLARDSHRVKGLVSFVSVSCALEMLVPKLEGRVEGGGEELTLVDVDNASYFIVMSTVGLEFLLHYDKVVTAFLVSHLLIN